MTSSTLASLRTAYAGARVLVTGHTGFKGGWLTLALAELGAHVTGLSLPPNTTPSLFDVIGVGELCDSNLGDIRDAAHVASLVARVDPDYVFHLAAQPLVRLSYQQPLETLDTNVMGTANVLDAVRRRAKPCTVVVVTSDKCYENREWDFAYREDDPMGGHDVYSMSKGAAELVVSSYRRSFFPTNEFARHRIGVATARAGNVIGGGDWSAERLVPDIIRALVQSEPVRLRNPGAIRPWQHVLDALGGYLLLGTHVARGEACEAWNFGPGDEALQTVQQLTEALIRTWGSGTWETVRSENAPHEARILRLSIDKVRARLAWRPRMNLHESVDNTVEWYREHSKGASRSDLRDLCKRQFLAYAQ